MSESRKILLGMDKSTQQQNVRVHEKEEVRMYSRLPNKRTGTLIFKTFFQADTLILARFNTY